MDLDLRINTWPTEDSESKVLFIDLFENGTSRPYLVSAPVDFSSDQIKYYNLLEEFLRRFKLPFDPIESKGKLVPPRSIDNKYVIFGTGTLTVRIESHFGNFCNPSSLYGNPIH